MSPVARFFLLAACLQWQVRTTYIRHFWISGLREQAALPPSAQQIKHLLERTAARPDHFPRTAGSPLWAARKAGETVDQTRHGRRANRMGELPEAP